MALLMEIYMMILLFIAIYLPFIVRTGVRGRIEGYQKPEFGWSNDYLCVPDQVGRRSIVSI